MITLGILTNMSQYIGVKCADRTSLFGHWRKWGPLYISLLSIPLVMADLVRHMLLDAHLINDLQMYKKKCEGSNAKCLTSMGWLFTVFFTWTGYACLFVGVFWAIDIHKKIKAQYAAVRNAGR